MLKEQVCQKTVMGDALKEDIAGHNPKNCAICRNNSDFELPEHLYNELLAERVILFAGAGVSTENSVVMPFTLYEEIAEELNLAEKQRPNFPSLMSLFCDRPDGRRELLRKIRSRFQYISSFPNLYSMATRFHNEVATLFKIESIVTTNWDDYFERECDATPFVTGEDFAFWSVPGRKVFKIHGSIGNLGSIVATTEDYDACYERLQTGALGSSLKHMLATKTILYAGYSLSDDDFLKIRALLHQEMGALLPHGYIVTIDREAETRYREMGLTPIFTDAAYFVSVIKQHLVEEGLMLPDEEYDETYSMLMDVLAAHHELASAFDLRDNPDLLYTLSYQDGLMDGLRRILVRRNSGEYSSISYVVSRLASYDKIRRLKVKARKYNDIAYIDGYMNAMLFLLANNEERHQLPIFYVYGAKDQPVTLEEFLALKEKAATFHRSAHLKAIKETKDLDRDIVLQHMPWLL